MTRPASVILVSIAILVACSTDKSTVPRDKELSKAQLGLWCRSNDGGKTCWGFEHFLDGNIVEACGKFPGERHSVIARGTHSTRGDTTCFVITQSSNSEQIQVGSQFCSQLLEINSQYQRHRLLNSDEVFTMYRIPESEKRCPYDA